MARRKKRKYGGLSLYTKKGSDIQWVRGTVRGNHVDKSLRTTSAELAEVLRNKLEKELLDASVDGKSRIKFSAAVAKYVKGKQKSHRYLERITEEIGDYYTEEITGKVVDAVAEKLMPNANSDSHNRHIYTPVMAVVRFCARKELCDPPKFYRNEPLPTKPVKPAKDAWIVDFISKTKNKRLRAYVALISTTGLRGSEPRLIRRDMTTFEFDEITQTWLGETTIEDPLKNGDPARVVIPHDAAVLMQEIEDDGSPTFFRYASADSANQVIKKECRKLGIPYYSTHKIGRHSFAARILAGGNTLTDLQKAGRWKTIAVPAKIYGHLEKTRVDDIVRNTASKLKIKKDDGTNELP